MTEPTPTTYVNVNTGEHVTKPAGYFADNDAWMTLADWQTFKTEQAEIVKQALIADPSYLGGDPGVLPAGKFPYGVSL